MIPSTIYLIWLLFFIYCVIGYVIECTYCAIIEGHFTNRGFLNGPYLPIYGSGAVASTLLLGQITDPVLLFLLGGTLCCALEWVTSYTMEKLYHARWWDYSHLPFNFQGRFWLGGFVEFGIGIDLVVLVVSPFLTEWLELLPSTTTMTLATVTFVCMAIDLVVSHVGATKMRAKMDELVAETRERATEVRAQAESFANLQREKAEARATEARNLVDAATTVQRERAEAMTAQALERVDELAAKRQEKAEVWAARSRAAAQMLADPKAWRQAIEWEMGERLRMAEDRARALQPDLPQLPALEEAARHFCDHLGAQERRMLNAFPNMRPASYRTLAEELAERFANGSEPSSDDARDECDTSSR